MTTVQLAFDDARPQPPADLVVDVERICRTRPDLYARSREIYCQMRDGRVWMVENPYYREER